LSGEFSIRSLAARLIWALEVSFNKVQRLGLAMLNRRFRSVLLALALVPTTLEYLWQTLVRPIVFPGNAPIDFFEDYVGSARLLASGTDPYSACLSRACWTDLANAWSLYPPVVSWLSLPLVHLDRGVVGAIALLGAELCVALFVWITARALQIRDWQLIALWALAVMAFPPLIGEVIARNLQVLLLVLSAVWFAGWLAGDRWWGGLALGAGIALKLAQAPSLLLTMWFRRWRASVAALIAIAVLWLVGAPQYLVEYLFRIVPGLNTGTGFAMNVAPVGAIARLFHPGSMYGDGTGIDTTVRVAGYTISALVTILTVLVLRSPRADREGRALEASLVIAATPLMVAVVRPGHLLLLLLPMMVLGTFALRRKDWRLGAGVAVSWILIGPIYLSFSNLLAAGVGAQFVRPGEETALAGAVVLWLAALITLRRHRVAITQPMAPMQPAAAVAVPASR